MIFSKEAIFPYPVLRNNSQDYIENKFEISVDLQENTSDYIFKISYEIGSEYIRELIHNNDAKLVIVILSKDNKFFYLNNDNTITISKKRISLNKRTSIQAIVRAEVDMEFSGNYDLVDMFDLYKSDIFVKKHGLLALSNVVYFDGSIKKPFDLFEKRLREDLTSDIQIELGSETIIISYRKEDFQFTTAPNSNILNYPYVYMGLQKALMRMVEDLSEEDTIYIYDMELPENGLYMKLFNLMKSKGIDEMSYNNIDHVIHKISDRIIEKYTNTVKGMYDNGN